MIVLYRWALFATLIAYTNLRAFATDELVSVQREFEGNQLNQTYRDLCQRKLLPKRDAMAKFLRLPAAGGTEIGMTIYQQRRSGRGDQPVFVLIIKEPSSALWGNVIASVSLDKRKKRIVVSECKVLLPDETARGVHDAWLAMLRHVRPAPDELILDSTREIFFARAPDGREIAGRLPVSDLGASTGKLYEIANLLYRCCRESGSAQAKTFRRIASLSTDITARVGRQ